MTSPGRASFWESARLALITVVAARVILAAWAVAVPQFRSPVEPASTSGSPYLDAPRIDEGLAGLLLGPWQRFDTQRYVRIARDGYVAPDDSHYPPLYPALIRIGAAPFGSGPIGRMFAALAVATLAAFGLFFLFHQLAVREVGNAGARHAVLFLALFPTGFFLFAGYSESLFIFLALASFVAARDGRFGHAGIFGALASMTRLTGWCLALPIAWEAYVRWNGSRKPGAPAGHQFGNARLLFALASAALPIVATAGFLIFRRNLGFPPLDETFGMYWARTPGVPGQDLVTAANTLFFGGAGRADQLPLLWIDFASAVGMLVATPFVFRRFGVSFGLLMAGILFFLLVATSSVLPLYSVARYVLPLFPAFLLFGMVTTNRPLSRRVLLTCSFGFWLLFSALFFSRNWVG
jgi:hypothetical protein